MNKFIRVSIIGLNQEITDNGLDIYKPSTYLKQLGFDIVQGESITVADCFIIEAKAMPEVLPSYVTVLEKPYKFSFSWEK